MLDPVLERMVKVDKIKEPGARGWEKRVEHPGPKIRMMKELVSCKALLCFKQMSCCRHTDSTPIGQITSTEARRWWC